MAFMFRENRRHGTDGWIDARTDGREQHLVRSPRQGRTFYHVPIQSEQNVCDVCGKYHKNKTKHFR